MISLIQWKEFGAEGGPLMKSAFAKEPYPGMEKIADYLDHGKITVAAAGIGTDVYTGERISGKKELLTDGEYSWNNTLSYYVRKYYLRLPTEFESKVLNYIK